MTYNLHIGDALSILKTMPAESVNCCVTSPPYWGLRDYGVPGQIWGGLPDCDHQWGDKLPPRGKSGWHTFEHKYHNPGSHKTTIGSKLKKEPEDSAGHGQFCQKCGAWFGALGLEPTPELFVAHMVEIFREVRRVLRDDGTLWLNLGTSYANSNDGRSWELNSISGHIDSLGKIGKIKHGDVCDKSPNRSPLLQRVPACGIDDIKSQDSQGADHACCDCGDGHQDDSLTHHADIVRNDQCASQDVRQTLQTTHGIEHSDCDQGLQGSLPSCAQESTQTAFSDGSPLSVSTQPHAFGGQQGDQTLSACVQESSRKKVCISGTSQILPPLVFRTVGKESFFSACGRSDCNGIGKCGLCWVNLAIASLNVKPKDELNIPHLVAMALQADGWILRQTIIWSKKNPMPESVKDRCAKAHEYIFLLSKSQRYYFDHEAIKEPSQDNHPHYKNTTIEYKSINSKRGNEDGKPTSCFKEYRRPANNKRNKRSVWTVSTKPYKGAHFATFPPDLIEPCILAGCPEGGTVLDPFGGSGTTGEVALKHFRKVILIELKPEYGNDLIAPRLEAEAQRYKQREMFK